MTDDQVAAILAVTVDWVRSHATEIPGLIRLGTYYRFHPLPVNEWLGGLNFLMKADEVAGLLKIPASWVYANADQIPGLLRLGRYVRFRPSVIRRFAAGPEACK